MRRMWWATAFNTHHGLSTLWGTGDTRVNKTKSPALMRPVFKLRKTNKKQERYWNSDKQRMQMRWQGVGTALDWAVSEGVTFKLGSEEWGQLKSEGRSVLSRRNSYGKARRWSHKLSTNHTVTVPTRGTLPKVQRSDLILTKTTDLNRGSFQFLAALQRCKEWIYKDVHKIASHLFKSEILSHVTA